MPLHDPRVDAYIERAAAFARPILRELRARAHSACPGLTENIKWGMPAFEYKGPWAGMAAFKAHCTFGFWKHELLIKDDSKSREAMGCFGRLTSLGDLPTKAVFRRIARHAVQLNDAAVPAVRSKTRVAAPTRLHPEFAAALAQSPKAKEFLESLPPGQRREYLNWIAEAKRAQTRAMRIATAVEWLADGKRRHWKYERKKGSGPGE